MYLKFVFIRKLLSITIFILILFSCSFSINADDAKRKGKFGIGEIYFDRLGSPRFRLTIDYYLTNLHELGFDINSKYFNSKSTNENEPSIYDLTEINKHLDILIFYGINLDSYLLKENWIHFDIGIGYIWSKFAGVERNAVHTKLKLAISHKVSYFLFSFYLRADYYFGKDIKQIDKSTKKEFNLTSFQIYPTFSMSFIF